MKIKDDIAIVGQHASSPVVPQVVSQIKSLIVLLVLLLLALQVSSFRRKAKMIFKLYSKTEGFFLSFNDSSI